VALISSCASTPRKVVFSTGPERYLGFSMIFGDTKKWPLTSYKIGFGFSLLFRSELDPPQTLEDTEMQRSNCLEPVRLKFLGVSFFALENQEGCNTKGNAAGKQVLGNSTVAHRDKRLFEALTEPWVKGKLEQTTITNTKMIANT